MKVYKNADILPAKALASAVFLANGEITDYGDFVKTLQDEDACITYRASNDTHEIYNEVYRKFVKPYPTSERIIKGSAVLPRLPNRF